MRRRDLPGLLLTAALWAACLPGCRESPPAPPGAGTAPSVLLITVDTLRPDYLSFSGYDLPTSPFMDSLFREGHRFPRALTPIPRTTQALASLMTGRYPRSTGVRRLFDTLPPSSVTLAELAREAGYRTIAVVTNHVLAPERGLDAGFEVYDHAPDLRDARATSDEAARHLMALQGDSPVFAWVHYIDPHVSYYPPESLARRFDPGYEGRYALHFGSSRGGTGDEAYPEDLPKARAVFDNPLDDRTNAHIRRLYAAEIRHADDSIALLVQWIRREMAGDWIILLAADHGESLGEHGYFYDHGDDVYQPGLAIPLALVLPPGHELAGSTTVEERVSLVDIFPTLAEAMGLPVPGQVRRGLEGISLAPALRGEPLPARPIFAECGMSFFPEMVPRRRDFSVKGRFRAIFRGPLKLIWTPGASGAEAAELYDLSSDPAETRDLYRPGEPPGEALLEEIIRWTGDDDPAPGAPPSPEDRERLRSLGYIDDES